MSLCDKTEIGWKIRVFISSHCGNEKYDNAREKLKHLIEETGLAEVYLFGRRASSVPPPQDYLYALDDSDVCIFLIDDDDGVLPGVLQEIKRAKSHPKKSLFVFCKGKKNEPTHIQKELEDELSFTFYKAASFDELVTKSFESLINDIINIYRNYCNNRLVDSEFAPNQKTTIKADTILSESLNKSLIMGIDKTKRYLTKQIFRDIEREINQTSELDTYCEDFLRVIFGEKSIREFNTSLLLSEIKKKQNEKLHMVVVNRWEAIQCYWIGDIGECINHLEMALSVAKNNQLPSWFIQDILIDLNNLYIMNGQVNNQIIYNSKAQQELDTYDATLFYPIVDRFDKFLYEELNRQITESSIRSPYTVTWGNNISRYADYISSIYVTSVFNGSLTHIIRIIDRLIDVAFNLCKEYSDWAFRVLLLKLAISRGNKKRIKGFINLFNDVLGKMNASDSKEIYKFCSNVPFKYGQTVAKLEAFSQLGYFFSDSDYEEISGEIFKLVEEWFGAENPVIGLADYIFEALAKNYLRMDNNTIIKMCLDVIDRKMYRFYDDALKLISEVGIKNAADALVYRTINTINSILIDDTLRNKYISSLERVIISIRSAKKEDLTDELHRNVLKYMPEFYKGTYALVTMSDSKEDLKAHICRYISKIKKRNKAQGKGGRYTVYGDDPYSAIKNIITVNNVEIDENLLKTIVEASRDTLLSPRQLLSAKISAIKLIIFIKLKSKVASYDYVSLINEIKKNKEVALSFTDPLFERSNIIIHFNYMIMRTVFNDLDYNELLGHLEMLNQFNDQEKIEALKTLVLLFENNYCKLIDRHILFLILQFVLGSSHDSNHDIRFWSVKTLLFMVTKDTKNVILTKISKMMDYDSVYIKNLILNQAKKLMSFAPDIIKFIIKKATIDNHYVIRKRGCELSQEFR